jgi:hypothetical protein
MIWTDRSTQRRQGERETIGRVTETETVRVRKAILRKERHLECDEPGAGVGVPQRHDAFIVCGRWVDGQQCQTHRGTNTHTHTHTHTERERERERERDREREE